MRDFNLKDFDRVLIVEGYSDLHFYNAVLKAIGLRDRVYIKQLGGKDELVVKLETFITPVLLAEKKAIAVIVDADGNPAGTFTQIQTALAKAIGQQVPAAGQWTAGPPKIGIFIVPNAESTGEIETLVWRAWSADPANASAKTCIANYIRCMAETGVNPQSPDKGLIGALLAIRNDDDPRLGPGAREDVFNLHAAEYEPLRTFLSGF